MPVFCLNFSKKPVKKIAIIHAPSWQKATSVMLQLLDTCVIQESIKSIYISKNDVKMKLIISTSCFFLTLRVLNTKRLTRLTASADTDPPPGVPDIHGHQLSSIRAVKYHISVYRTKSQILCACKQKVRCHVHVTRKSDVMFL